jgi:hypothetical protein
MEDQWNDIDREKPRESEENLSQYHSDHHKFPMDYYGSEFRHLQ